MKELLYLKDDQLKDLIEKLFIAYRDTFADPKKILDKHSIGIAHHKVIHLLSMYEGISISELLQKLKVIRFEKDGKDTRVKHLYLDEKGKKLFKEIFEIQKKRIYAALLSSKSEEVINFDNVLKKIING